MSIISEPLPTTDRNGTPINTDYRNMIRLIEVEEDRKIPEDKKVFVQLGLFYKDFPEQPEGMSDLDFIQSCYNEMMYFYNCGGDIEKAKIAAKKQKNSPQAFDFEIDAGRILADFQASYGIDLSDINTRIHWWRFKQLFENLPDDTTMAKFMQSRTIVTDKMSKEQKKYWEARKRATALKKKVAFRSIKDVDKASIEWAAKKLDEAHNGE